MNRVKMVIDTDGGVDDAVAILWAATHKDVDLLAITVVHGNVDSQIAAENVCRVLELAGRYDVPVVSPTSQSEAGIRSRDMTCRFTTGESGSTWMWRCFARRFDVCSRSSWSSGLGAKAVDAFPQFDPRAAD